jgi:hypothetical protein
MAGPRRAASHPKAQHARRPSRRPDSRGSDRWLQLAVAVAFVAKRSSSVANRRQALVTEAARAIPRREDESDRAEALAGPLRLGGSATAAACLRTLRLRWRRS